MASATSVSFKQIFRQVLTKRYLQTCVLVFQNAFILQQSIQMVESDGPLKVENQIHRVPILRLLDCKKRRYIEPLYTRQSSYKLRGLNHQYHI